MSGNQERRRIARIPVRCGVAVREKLSSWVGETEDLGLRGCRIALKRQVAPGALLQLAFDAGPGAEPLVVLGQVAWASRAAPLVAGVKFLAVPREAQNPQPGFWLDRLVAGRLRRLAGRGPSAAVELGPLGGVRLHVCGNPGPAPSAAEQAVVTLARGEGTIATAGHAAERLGALAALLDRGVLTIALGGAAPALGPAAPLARIEVTSRAVPGSGRPALRVITPPLTTRAAG